MMSDTACSCAATHVKLNNVNKKTRQLKLSIEALFIISSHCGNNLISLIMCGDFVFDVTQN